MKKEQKVFIKAMGRRLGVAQELAKMDDYHVGPQAGFSVQEYREYKKGDRTPNAFRLARLAQVLNVTTDYLVGLQAEDSIIE